MLKKHLHSITKNLFTVRKTIISLIIVLFLTSLTLFGCTKNPEDVSGSTETFTVEEITTEEISAEETTMMPPSADEPSTEEPAAVTPSTEELSTEEPEAESPPTEPTTEAPTTETAPSLTINDISFVGDSRTLTMATGGRLEFGLIPDGSVFATWGGELHQDSAKNNALAAAAADRKLAIFWYGINDVQSDPGQTLADQFLANYKAVIDLYRSGNPNGDVVILSILSTSVHEKDYYDGQEENILRYNAKLADLCSQEGYTYLDITELFTGDECLAPGDNIHFSREWYETRFLPTIYTALNIKR